ncbi:MAG: acyltransferase [Desulfobulbus sp.]|nr:acyltransferase [Desulfobulbus sp.]
MKKLQSIQMLRGFGALGVVLFHCLAIEGKYFGDVRILPKLFVLGQTGVDLFFVISGFVMVIATGGRHGVPLETRRFLWGRLTRIYPVYWFYFALTTGAFLIRSEWVNASQGHQADFLTSFFLLPTHHLPLVIVAWSLIHELWFYLVFAGLIIFSERMLPVLLFMWAVVVLLADLILTGVSLPPFMQIVLHPYTLEFIIGGFSALAVRKISRVLTRSEFIAALLLLVCGLAVAARFSTFSEPNMLRAVYFGILYGFTLIVAVVAERSGRLRVPSLFLAIGNSSYTIYLSHLLVISAIGRIWSLWFTAWIHPLTNAVIFLVMLVAVTVYGWFAYRLIELPLLRLSRRLRTLWFETPAEGKRISPLSGQVK